MKIFGANLPASVQAEDIGFGQGVKVTRSSARRPDELAIEVDVAADAPIGPRDVSVAGTVKPAALVVYDKIDGIKVLPQAGHGARRRRRLPEAVPAVRGGGHRTTAPTASPTPPTT